MSQIENVAILALTLFREARGGSQPGMASVANVVMNRVRKNGTDAQTECLKKWQFSSMTAPSDPQLERGPNALNATEWSAYLLSLQIAQFAIEGNLPDKTGGATLYYNPAAIRTDQTITIMLDGTAKTIPWPKTWDRAKVEFKTFIAGHYFFTED